MIDAPERKRYPDFDKRMRLIGAALILALALLVARLWQLQIVEGEHYAREADNNRLRPQVLQAPRGMIYGRDTSVVLADNRAATDLVFVPADCDDPEAVAQRLENLLGVNAARLLTEVERHRRQPFTQIPVKQDISRRELMLVEERSHALPGVFTIVRPQRRYLYGATGGQLLGYLGEIGREELQRMRPRYKMGDRIGRAGIERAYENMLHGQDGQLLVNVFASGSPQVRTDPYGRPQVEFDSFGRRLQQETHYPAEAGDSIHLTLDIELQAYAESLLEGERGSIVVLNADTGEVLAMASMPTYDPSVFVNHGQNQERIDLLNDPEEPMKNRGYQDVYPPGSVFKIVMAAAAMEEGLINENTQFYCPGHFQINNRGRRWRCWRRGGHGSVKLDEALAYSCDVYFYHVGLRLGVDRINHWSALFALGVPTGIDLPREETGLIPSREWKRAIREPHFPDEPWEWNWYDGDTVNLSIGQGATNTSPLQTAIMTAAVINGGRRVYPYINQELGPRVSEPFMSEATVEAVQAGLRMCVEKTTFPTGTGHRAKIPGMDVLGKTGTAQVVALHHHEGYEDVEDIPYEHRHHAWFVAGVTDRYPRIAVAVLVEHGHAGGAVASPIARDVIEFFYDERAPSDAAFAMARGEEEEEDDS